MIFAFCTGCEKSNKKIDSIVKNFYSSGYDYKKILTLYKGEEVISQTISEGQIFQNPYKEHAKIIASSNENIWDEIYCDKSSGYILTDSQLQESPIKMPNPYGYGENITFKQKVDITLDGKKVVSHAAEYTVDIGKTYGIKESLKAIIKQEYIIDPHTGIIIKIKTDLSEQNKINEIAVQMSANKMSYEEALKAYEKNIPYKTEEELYIYNFQNPTEFDMPEKTNN